MAEDLNWDNREQIQQVAKEHYLNQGLPDCKSVAQTIQPRCLTCDLLMYCLDEIFKYHMKA